MLIEVDGVEFPFQLMPSQPSQTQELRARVSLLREVIEVLGLELSTLSNRQWDDLPDLKKRKVILASRLGKFDWKPRAADQGPSDVSLLKSHITDLEGQSRQKIQSHFDLIGNQIVALQDQHQYWLECLSVSFQKFCDPVPLP